MATYARINGNNTVIQVIYVDDETIRDPYDSNTVNHDLGIEQAKKTFPGEWLRCEYDGYRRICPSIGDTYDKELDCFIEANPPYASWTFNRTTKQWEAPLTKPELTADEIAANNQYDWDEDAYQTDNTTGWVLTPPGAIEYEWNEETQEWDWLGPFD